MSMDFAAAVVTCQVWLLSRRGSIARNRLFDHEMWMAMERSHYMQSSKNLRDGGPAVLGAMPMPLPGGM